MRQPLPGRDLSRDRLAMRNLMRQRACSHGGAVEVESGGERVAWLCPDCDAQLPADHWITEAERDLLPGYYTAAST